jgi:hypothetical protein
MILFMGKYGTLYRCMIQLTLLESRFESVVILNKPLPQHSPRFFAHRPVLTPNLLRAADPPIQAFSRIFGSQMPKGWVVD